MRASLQLQEVKLQIIGRVAARNLASNPLNRRRRSIGKRSASGTMQGACPCGLLCHVTLMQSGWAIKKRTPRCAFSDEPPLSSIPGQARHGLRQFRKPMLSVALDAIAFCVRKEFADSGFLLFRAFRHERRALFRPELRFGHLVERLRGRHAIPRVSSTMPAMLGLSG
ncbi:hypothetical protein [Caballeronia sp. NCTM5]|uniref:hypothetical protein n=1 Tax=Caballeronia sp. NCTM5 TaxID=2921755 RepID=UPI002027DB43|nr:hypothetical protein [Caballeronia sp. NCTM5]